eukprot:Plantae.Rhodophyta-Purpureofilum_apyrenoidigerum.ctg9717.p1 GENE.Plantae.Rhodophyta-Purpureofilum_apyrenoidigerum.ctg9717~~Plantae.Rhodophyta-Purpureofilum_apyrenoidigerum.ctg9717.p1  ORF type:complete len:364 (-),score=35.68 Plantae.Rhodophyta-Purpureofilum_apyrenoidigerum.ctg9717:1194-2285(-)
MFGLHGATMVRANVVNEGAVKVTSPNGGHESVQATVRTIASDPLTAPLQDIVPRRSPSVNVVNAKVSVLANNDCPSLQGGTLGIKRELNIDSELKAKRLRAHWQSLWTTPHFEMSKDELDNQVQSKAAVDGYSLIAESTNSLKNGDEVRTFQCEGVSTCGCPFRARWKRFRRSRKVVVASLHEHAHNARRLRVPLDPSVKQYITRLRKNGYSVSIINDSVNRAITDGTLNAARPSSLTVRNYCYSLSRELGSKGKESTAENLTLTNASSPDDAASRKSSSAHAAGGIEVKTVIEGADDEYEQAEREGSAKAATKRMTGANVNDELENGANSNALMAEKNRSEPTSTVISRMWKKIGRLFGYGT